MCLKICLTRICCIHYTGSSEKLNQSCGNNGLCVFSGRNQGFRHNFSSYAEWEKTYGYQLSSGSGSESDDSDLDSDEKKNAGK